MFPEVYRYTFALFLRFTADSQQIVLCQIFQRLRDMKAEVLDGLAHVHNVGCEELSALAKTAQLKIFGH